MNKISKWVLENILLILIIWSMFYIANILNHNRVLEKRVQYLEQRLIDLENSYIKIQNNIFYINKKNILE